MRFAKDGTKQKRAKNISEDNSLRSQINKFRGYQHRKSLLGSTWANHSRREMTRHIYPLMFNNRVHKCLSIYSFLLLFFIVIIWGKHTQTFPLQQHPPHSDLTW